MHNFVVTHIMKRILDFSYLYLKWKGQMICSIFYVLLVVLVLLNINDLLLFKYNYIIILKEWLTSAPSSTKVSIRTAVWTVIWRHPAIRAPFRGLVAPCLFLKDIKPGISFSARVISLRPHSDNEISAAYSQFFIN